MKRAYADNDGNGSTSGSDPEDSDVPSDWDGDPDDYHSMCFFRSVWLVAKKTLFTLLFFSDDGGEEEPREHVPIPGFFLE